MLVTKQVDLLSFFVLYMEASDIKNCNTCLENDMRGSKLWQFAVLDWLTL